MDFKLTIHQAAELAQGLMALDNAGAPGREPFKFTASMRMRLGRNLAALRTQLQLFEQVRNKMANELPPQPKPEDQKTADRELNALAAELTTYALEPFSEADLQLERNPIPIQALAQIGPLIQPGV